MKRTVSVLLAGLSAAMILSVSSSVAVADTTGGVPIVTSLTVAPSEITFTPSTPCALITVTIVADPQGSTVNQIEVAEENTPHSPIAPDSYVLAGKPDVTTNTATGTVNYCANLDLGAGHIYFGDSKIDYTPSGATAPVTEVDPAYATLTVRQTSTTTLTGFKDNRGRVHLAASASYLDLNGDKRRIYGQTILLSRRTAGVWQTVTSKAIASQNYQAEFLIRPKDHAKHLYRATLVSTDTIASSTSAAIKL